MRLLHLGFAVSAYQRDKLCAARYRREDRFVLKQAAVECARRLEAEAWQVVEVHEVRRWDVDAEGDEELIAVEWRPQ